MSQYHSERFLKLAADAKTRITEITPAAAATQQATGAVVIDVREEKEFTAAHIPAAVHLSRGVLESQIETLAPNLATPIICYCSGGNRGALAAESLQKMGYTNVVSVAGGLNGWLAAALPVSNGTAAT